MGTEFTIGAKDAIVPPDRIAEDAAFGDAQRQRFFTADVFAGSGRGGRHGYMPVVGRGDHDRIDVRPVQ